VFYCFPDLVSRRTAGEATPEIDQMAAQVLDDLYRQVPGSKALLEGAAGYAVFTSLA
jgi:hypothetical protein